MSCHVGGRTRFILAASLIALAAPAALAEPANAPAPLPPPPHKMGPPRIDLNGDGFISRDEARAAAEKMFDHLDTNHDGKLDAADRPMHGPGHMRHEEMRDEHEDDDGPAAKRVEIRRDGPGDHHMHHRGGPPMALMMFLSREEADLNHDGALSKEEFVNMQLRFFDAADVNGDGRIKLDMPMPPEPPEPPLPPAPAQPPRR